MWFSLILISLLTYSEGARAIIFDYQVYSPNYCNKILFEGENKGQNLDQTKQVYENDESAGDEVSHKIFFIIETYPIHRYIGNNVANNISNCVFSHRNLAFRVSYFV